MRHLPDRWGGACGPRKSSGVNRFDLKWAVQDDVRIEPLQGRLPCSRVGDGQVKSRLALAMAAVLAEGLDGGAPGPTVRPEHDCYSQLPVA